jgi:hypothetical protein
MHKCVKTQNAHKLKLKVQTSFSDVIVAPLYVATPLNVALAAKCRTIDAKCRNRR